jgi:hypothetical protein
MITSVKTMTSFPDPGGLNFTLLKPHPGARTLNLGRSHESLGGQVVQLPLADTRVLSLSNTFKGLELLTSQTTTKPSWLATANLVPSFEKEVENEAARADSGDVYTND